MLGRHVYRVSPLETGGWIVRKEGEAQGRGSRDTSDEAKEFACTLAAEDRPSKVIVESAGGAIVEERLFGADAASAAEEGAVPDLPETSSSNER